MCAISMCINDLFKTEDSNLHYNVSDIKPILLYDGLFYFQALFLTTEPKV